VCIFKAKEIVFPGKEQNQAKAELCNFAKVEILDELEMVLQTICKNH